MKAPDFAGFYIQKDYEFEVYYFHFIQKNSYVTTEHVMTYLPNPDYYLPDRAFYESYSRHTHEGLVEDRCFKKLIESTGLEFDRCFGGYKTRLDSGCDVTLTGEVEITVYFKDNGERRPYKLDLDEMKISDKY